MIASSDAFSQALEVTREINCVTEFIKEAEVGNQKQSSQLCLTITV